MSIEGDDVEGTAGKRRWQADQRLDFIEFRLFWDGSLQRSDIVERFAVSMPQASADLALYKRLAPGNMDYDASQKRFLATPEFQPRLAEPNPDRYLIQLRAIADHVITKEDTHIGFWPSVGTMPIPHRKVDANVVRKLVRAIRDKKSLSVHYHSMNSIRPHPIWRDITPHAFAYDGLRWHLRGYCHLETRFKDFVLSRFLAVGEERAAEHFAKDDVDWATFFPVILVPNPKLSASQQKTVAMDYNMTDGKLFLHVRCALLYYFNKRLRLDVAQQVDDPKETPVIVANRSAFEAALVAATATN